MLSAHPVPAACRSLLLLEGWLLWADTVQNPTAGSALARALLVARSGGHHRVRAAKVMHCQLLSQVVCALHTQTMSGCFVAALPLWVGRCVMWCRVVSAVLWQYVLGAAQGTAVSTLLRCTQEQP